MAIRPRWYEGWGEEVRQNLLPDGVDSGAWAGTIRRAWCLLDGALFGGTPRPIEAFQDGRLVLTWNRGGWDIVLTVPSDTQPPTLLTVDRRGPMPLRGLVEGDGVEARLREVLKAISGG